MDDAARLKTPTVVCHASDGSFVLAREGYACQTATIEHIIAYARHAVRDCNACQACAVAERQVFNTRNRIWYRNVRQACTAVEYTVDARHAVRYSCVRKACATKECLEPDACHGIRYHHVR